MYPFLELFRRQFRHICFHQLVERLLPAIEVLLEFGMVLQNGIIVVKGVLQVAGNPVFRICPSLKKVM